MRPSLLRVLALGSVAVAAAAGCKKAELDDPRATAIVLTLSSDTLDADGGSLTVTAQAVEDAVPVLGAPIRIAVSGANTIAEQAVTPDEETGIATVELTGLVAAGANTVTARTGNGASEITQTGTFTVVPGAPASLSFQIVDNAIAAGEAPGYVTEVYDAFTNLIAAPPVLISTTAEDAVYVTGNLIEFRRAGTWGVNATVEGTALAEQVLVTVSPAAAAQVLTALDRSVAGTLQTVRISCTEMDAFGNERPTTFTAGTEVFTTPTSTVAAVAGTSGLFTASGFTLTGSYTATCVSAVLSDDKPFNVVPQTPTRTVLATVSQNLVDAGLAITVNCKELDEFGAVLPTPAGMFTFTLPTNPSGATNDGGAGDASAADGIDFVIGGGALPADKLDVLGQHTARCAVGALTPDTDDFAVVDLTAPVLTQADVTAATGPEGLQADDHYSPGTTLTVTADASDFMGVRALSIEVVSGPGTATEMDLFPAGTKTVTDDTLSALVNVNAATFATVVYRVRAEDASGNASTRTVTETVTVDPALAFDVPPGATIRTLYEENPITIRGFGLATDGTDLFVQRSVVATDNLVDVVRVTGETAPATSSPFITALLPAAPGGAGLVATTTPFGGRTFFHTLDAETVDGTTIATTNTGAHILFAGPNGTLPPGDMVLGDLGQGRKLYFEDEAGSIFTSDSAGNISAYTAFIGTNLAMTVQGTTLWAMDFDGDLSAVTDTGGGPVITPKPPNNFGALPVRDLAFGSGKIIVGGGGLVSLVDPALLTRSDISGSFIDVRGVAVKSNGNLYILANPTEGLWRIYKVTGY